MAAFVSGDGNVSRVVKRLLLLGRCCVAGCSLDFGRFKGVTKGDAAIGASSPGDGGASPGDGGGSDGGVCDSGLPRSIASTNA